MDYVQATWQLREQGSDPPNQFHMKRVGSEMCVAKALAQPVLQAFTRH